MMDDPSSVAVSLIWGNLRNLIDFESVEIPGDIKIVGTTIGEFPIDAYEPFFLETSRDVKRNIVGRGYHAFGIGMKDTDWNYRRTLALPIYHHDKDVNMEKFGMMVRYWKDALIPDEIPCIALAIKTQGYYCDDRESQSLLVLVIWYDGVGKILELDWAEGPLEDCVTPEWRLKSTDLLSLNNALTEVKRICKHSPTWENLLFSIYINPSCLGDNLQGKKMVTSQRAWRYEWRYRKHANLTKDLDLILGKVKNIFSMKKQFIYKKPKSKNNSKRIEYV